MHNLELQLVLTLGEIQWYLTLQLWIKLLLNPVLNVLKCFLAESQLKWGQKRFCSFLRTKLQPACENSWLMLEQHSSGALSPKPNTHQSVLCLQVTKGATLWTRLPLLIALLYHVGIVSVNQKLLFMSGRRGRKTHFYCGSSISKTLLLDSPSCCLLCFLLGASAASMLTQTLPNIFAAVLWHTKMLVS